MNKDFDTRVDLSEGNYLQWYCQRQILFVAFENCSDHSIDETLEAVIDILRRDYVDRPIYIVTDFSSQRFVLTPFFRKRISTTNDQFNNLSGRNAIIIADNSMGRIVQIFVNLTLAFAQPKLKRELFLDRDEAFHWVSETFEEPCLS